MQQTVWVPVIAQEVIRPLEVIDSHFRRRLERNIPRPSDGGQTHRERLDLVFCLPAPRPWITHQRHPRDRHLFLSLDRQNPWKFRMQRQDRRIRRLYRPLRPSEGSSVTGQKTSYLKHFTN